MSSAHARLWSALLLTVTVTGAGCTLNVIIHNEPARQPVSSAAAAQSSAQPVISSTPPRPAVSSAAAAQGSVQPVVSPIPPRPASCAEIRAANADANDGDYQLYINRDPAKPWTAHCVGMSGSPKEYLRLVNVDGRFNFSGYRAGGASPGSNVKTSYHEVRINPTSLLVDISDQRFSRSYGSLSHSPSKVTSMPYGVAMSCDGSASGMSNIDLRETPFAVAPAAFVQGGAGPSGTSSYSSNDQVVNLMGGGLCGWTVARPDTFNPFNNAGGFQLPLIYVAPASASSHPVAGP